MLDISHHNKFKRTLDINESWIHEKQFHVVEQQYTNGAFGLETPLARSEAKQKL